MVKISPEWVTDPEQGKSSGRIFTLKYTIISLLHVSVFNDHHQGALSVPV